MCRSVLKKDTLLFGFMMTLSLERGRSELDVGQYALQLPGVVAPLDDGARVIGVAAGEDAGRAEHAFHSCWRLV